MCYLGIGYLGDAFVDIVQSLSPVRSVNSLQDASRPCVISTRERSQLYLPENEAIQFYPFRARS